MKRYIRKIIFLVIALTLVITSLFEIQSVSKEVVKYMPTTGKTIVLDAGHGEMDPGTFTDDKAILEKDLNLAIVLKLRALIEASGANVVLTREADERLYEDTGNKTTREKYSEDLKNRRKLVQESNGDLFVSIHMNKLAVGNNPEKYKGAQTWYSEVDGDSKNLAKTIQDELKRVVDGTNNREVKSGKGYYILKEVPIPSVLVECGFLSNAEEAQLLTEDDYQDKVAWAIYVGIQKYLSEGSK